MSKATPLGSEDIIIIIACMYIIVRVLNPLELELQMIVCCHVDSDN